SWSGLPEQERWEVVTYIKSLTGSPLAPAQTATSSVPNAVSAKPTAPPPTAPFTDYRFEKPGRVRHIKMSDLPAPFATQSATNGPKVVARPEAAWPKAPDGFKVQLYASGLNNP